MACCSRKGSTMALFVSSGSLCRTLAHQLRIAQRQKLARTCVRRPNHRGVDRSIAERVVSGAETALRDWTFTMSNFLTPPESAAMVKTISMLPDMYTMSWGGYEDAERMVVFCAHSDIASSSEELLPLVQEKLVLLKVTGEFESQQVSHRDFLGAVLNAGISRRKVGDILILENRGAEVIVHADVADFLVSSVTAIRNINARVEKHPLAAIEIPPKRVKELQSVEASMRLDAVVSAGFNVSRSKLAAMSKSGLVSVNYKEVKGPAKTLRTGDIVSVRGLGKLEIGECSHTAKGRYRIAMRRYL